MIPKIIHYCWFGCGEMPKLAKKCIESWKKYCPDYEIMVWNEDNFDLESDPYLKWCYENKKWAFLSDLVRLLVVQKYGGIYFDTDVELVRCPDFLLGFDAFYGFENDEFVASGLGFGSVPNHVVINQMVEEYRNLIVDDSFVPIGCPTLNTKALLRLGLVLNGERQSVCGAEILPEDFLNPYDDPTGRLNKTENTVSIHWYSKSALSKKAIVRSKITRPFHRIFGKDCFQWLKK